MKLTTLFYITGVLAINCKNHNVLSNYRIAETELLIESDLDTPPSKTHSVWYINPCEEPSKKDRPSECASDDLVCGLTRVKLDNKDLLTQIIDIHKSSKYEIEENTESEGVNFIFSGVKWGSNTLDAYVDFTCDKNLKTDELVDSIWSPDRVDLSLTGPSGCKRDGNNDNNNNNDNGDKDKDRKPTPSSGKTSWFTWLFIWALLFTLIYLLVISYLNTRGGSFQDFRNEFVERGSEFVTSLPTFIKEVANKVIGTRESSGARGGYSAV